MTAPLLDKAFAILEAAAVAGERCPENGTMGLNAGVVPALARAGRIRIAICLHNYRIVTLLSGPHAGKSTAPHPDGRKPWKVIDAGGTRRLGTMQAPKSKAPITLANIRMAG
jgi:hypothetical protein